MKSILKTKHASCLQIKWNFNLLFSLAISSLSLSAMELPREKDRIYTAIETDHNSKSCEKFCWTCTSMIAPLISLPFIPLQESSDKEVLTTCNKSLFMACALSLSALGNFCQSMCSDFAKEAQEQEIILNTQLQQFSTMSDGEWHNLHRKWEQGDWDYAYGPMPNVRME